MSKSKARFLAELLNSAGAVNVDAGTIDGAVIGGTTAAAGSFTNITVSGTVDGRDVATDGTKLDGIEAGATADQTAAEIRALVEAATDSNVFTDADHTKLNGIEALADVTDTTNVTAAGALMDSELTNITAVKALNQGVATTDSPSFAGLTATTGIDVTGTVTADGLTLDGNDSYTSNIKFDYGASAPTYFANWGYKSSSDGNKVFLTITDGGPAKDVLVANYNGNVGIGTDTPSNRLHIEGPASSHTALQIETTTSGFDPTIHFVSPHNSAGMYLDGTVDNKIKFYNGYGKGAAGREITFDNSGNVGIGTSSPVEKLDISQSVNNSVITKVTNTNSGDLASARVEVHNNDSSFGQLTTYSSGFGYLVFGSSAANWTFIGSSGANSNGLKIGTLTADPIVFGTNDTERMRIDASGNLTITGSATIEGLTVGKGAGAVSTNTAVGVQAAAANTTGAQSAYFGWRSGFSNTTGDNNAALGDFSLYANTTGSANTAIGRASLASNTTASYNTAVGMQALNANTTASNNTAVGYQAGYSTTTGSIDAFGYLTGYSNTTGSGNVYFGRQTGYSATTAIENTGIGYYPLYTNTGSYNSALGYAALYYNTTGQYNTALGTRALQANTTASNNTAVGYQSLFANTTGVQNTAVGALSLDANTTGSYNAALGEKSLSTNILGSKSTAIGTFALFNQNPASAVDMFNTAVGYDAGNAVTTGVQNTLIGGLAGDAQTTASNNTAVGYASLGANTTGPSNTAIGHSAMAANTTGNTNTAVGNNALAANTVGDNNTALGNDALASFNPSSNSDTFNTAVGSQAGAAVTTGIQNTLIGGLAGDAITTASNNTAVGYQALTATTTGGDNDAFGSEALRSLTTANLNVALGRNAMYSTTTGASNLAAGTNAMYSNTEGGSNVALGKDALRSNTTASNNTAVGYQAGYSGTTGATNSYFGFQAGYGITTGGVNTFLGYNAGASITTGSKNTIIGAYGGNQGGLDIRTASNHIVLSDGDGNPRAYWDAAGAATFGGAITTIGSAVAATNVELTLNGVAAKAKRVAFASSGVDQWLIGQGAASENDAFEIYNTNGQIAVSIAKATSALTTTGAATFGGAVESTKFNTVADRAVLDAPSGDGRFRVSTNSTTYGFFRANTSVIQIGTDSVEPLDFHTNNVFRMRLDGSGNLGVGVSPSYKLDVSGSPGDVVRFTGDANNSMRAYLGSAYQIFQCVNSGTTNQFGYVGGNFYVQTAGTERMRIDASGNLLVGTTAVTTFAGVSAAQNFVTPTNGSWTAGFRHSTNVTPWGLAVDYSGAAPNNTSSNFIYCTDSTPQLRFSVRSNGGVENYQANDVNLSDRREKTNFSPSKSYLDVICSIPVQTFNYIDQNMEDDPGLTLGVVAQDVQAVAPEFVMESNWGTEEDPKMRLSLYQTDLQYALMKCIQEQQDMITSLTARIEALEGA